LGEVETIGVVLEAGQLEGVERRREEISKDSSHSEATLTPSIVKQKAGDHRTVISPHTAYAKMLITEICTQLQQRSPSFLLTAT
jgi:hypothetical protein